MRLLVKVSAVFSFLFIAGIESLRAAASVTDLPPIPGFENAYSKVLQVSVDGRYVFGTYWIDLSLWPHSYAAWVWDREGTMRVIDSGAEVRALDMSSNAKVLLIN